ncbi:MAG: PAS domain S-box protein [Desulfuromonadaceae bacterium]|nr:PAS domain S-box protein [Desulfuromonadaceae bacterium]
MLDNSIFLSLLMVGIFALVGVAFSILLYKKNESFKTLRKSEQHFRCLVETASDWIWEMDAAGRYTFASAQVLDLLGYAPPEILGKTLLDRMDPVEARHIEEKFKNIIKDQQPFHLVKKNNLHRDGRQVVFESNGLPFFDNHGKLAGYRGVDRDISERDKSQDALHLALHSFDSSISGIVMADLR